MLVFSGVQPTSLAREVYYQEIVIVNNTKVGVEVNVRAPSVPSRKFDVSSAPSTKVDVKADVSSASCKVVAGFNGSSVPETKVGVTVYTDSNMPGREVGV